MGTQELPTFLSTTTLQRCKLIYAFEGGKLLAVFTAQSNQFPNYSIFQWFNKQ